MMVSGSIDLDPVSTYDGSDVQRPIGYRVHGRTRGLGDLGAKPILRRSWGSLTPEQQRIAKAYGYGMSGLGAARVKGNDATHVNVGRVTRANRAAQAIKAAALRQEVLHTQSEIKKGNPPPPTPLLKAHAAATGKPVVIPPAKKGKPTPAIVITPPRAVDTPISVNIPAPEPVNVPPAEPGYEKPAPSYTETAYESQSAAAQWNAQNEAGNDAYFDGPATQEETPYDDYGGYGPTYEDEMPGLGIKLGKIIKKVTKATLPIAAGVVDGVLTGGVSTIGRTILRTGGDVVRREIGKAMRPNPALPPARAPARSPARGLAPSGPVDAPASSPAPSWVVPALVGVALLAFSKR